MEISDADRQKAVRDLATIVVEERHLALMLRAKRVQRYVWHPAD